MLFLAEFVKGGAPGLEVLEPLIMYNAIAVTVKTDFGLLLTEEDKEQ